MPHDNVLSVILGGGRGTRLYPLTKLRTKPAVPLGGKYRLIDIPISNCINSGFDNIFVLTQFLSASLHRHIQRTYKFDVFSSGYVEILAAEQTLTADKWYQGTADAVRQQMSHLQSRAPDDVLILAGDHLYRMDYTPFVRFHRERRADLTISVLSVPAADAGRYGILKANSEGRIVDFEEKPRSEESLARLASQGQSDHPYHASMGIYVFRMEALTRLLQENTGDDFGKRIIPAAIETMRVYAYPFQGYWQDIGTVASFFRANLALTQPDPSFDFCDPNRPIYTRSRFLPPSRIDGCRIENAVVADGCKLYDANIEECVIGLRSIIRPGVRLRRVILMGADDYQDQDAKIEDHHLDRPLVGIGENTQIERAIIDKNACIGQNVVIASHEGEPDREEKLYAVRDGIVVIPSNTIIPDGSII